MQNGFSLSIQPKLSFEAILWSLGYCCDVAVTQINYPNLSKQDNIEQARGQSHKEVLVQIFMLDVMQFGGFWDYLEYSRIKQSSKFK